MQNGIHNFTAQMTFSTFQREHNTQIEAAEDAHQGERRRRGMMQNTTTQHSRLNTNTLNFEFFFTFFAGMFLQLLDTFLYKSLASVSNSNAQCM